MMTWRQVINPLHNIALSALVALLPILFIFWALIIKRMKGYKASMIAVSIAIVIAIIVYKMPMHLAVLSTANGALYGLFPIGWIIVSSLFLFNLTVESGQFEIIKHFMASITPDRRLQALLIAFSFGSFLEGTTGFGAPVAITAAMLVGLGFNSLYAAGICLIANTAPVAFGGIGIPVTVASQVTSIPELAVSQMVGRTLPFLSLFVPFYLVALMSGVKSTKQVLPAVLVSGVSFAFLQWISSNYLGPALPDVIAGIGSIVSLVIFLKFWKPASVWRFENETISSASADAQKNYTARQIIKAWSPFILLTIIIIGWGMPPIRKLLDTVGYFRFHVPLLHNAIIDKGGKMIPHIFKLNYLSASGTAIFFSALISIYIIGITFRDALTIFVKTIKQLKYPLISIAGVLAFAYIVNDSGITITIAEALSNTGVLFPFFAPVLGWLGVFITGSDTSANALFGKLQAATAVSIGVDPVVTVSANISGGVVGKMISPQSIAVAAAAGNLVGHESKLFRFTIRHSFIMLLFICFIVFGQAYLFHSFIPQYNTAAPQQATSSPEIANGYIYLTVLISVITALLIMIKYKSKEMFIKQNDKVSARL